MSYRILCDMLPRDLVGIVMLYANDKECFNQEYQSTINWYIVWIVPKALKYKDWKTSLKHNPFVQSYLLTTDYYTKKVNIKD